MHIPDGFLSPPVWATLDLAAVPAVAWAMRRAQSDLASLDDRRIPLLGVMGAFVFAAQMINFPVGLGTSGHLVGGALLSITLGPAAAAIVMTAILILQALVFQDGGIVVLGANVINMAIAGVLAGYLPYWLWGRGRSRGVAIFLGGLASVAVSACLALAELRISGIPMPGHLLTISFALFAASACIEGAITLTAVRAIERLNPAWIRPSASLGKGPALALACAAFALLAAALAGASAAPDTLQALLSQRVAEGNDIAALLRRASLGLATMMLLYATCAFAGRWIARRATRSGDV